MAPNLLRAAQNLPGGEQVRFALACAEQVPFADQSFDVLSAVQCWHWFERKAASEQIRHLLRPGGVFLIVTFDWLALSDNVVQLTEELIERQNPCQPKPHIRVPMDTGIYPQLCARCTREAWPLSRASPMTWT